MLTSCEHSNGYNPPCDECKAIPTVQVVNNTTVKDTDPCPCSCHPGGDQSKSTNGECCWWGHIADTTDPHMLIYRCWQHIKATNGHEYDSEYFEKSHYALYRMLDDWYDGEQPDARDEENPIETLVRKAVEAERERCSKIAEAYLSYDYNMADTIAKEIRNPQ